MSKVTTLFDSGKSGNLSVELMEVTPDIAKQWLLSTDKSIQRRLNLSHVTYLAREMKNGNWDLNGQPIQIDTNGNAVNGQHRLNACIESNTPFMTLVVFGVDTSSIKTIDEGSKPRGLSDFLDINYSCTHSDVIAAAMKFVFQWDLGLRRAAGKKGEIQGSNVRTSIRMSPADAVAFLDKNPGFFQFINEAISLYQAGDKLMIKSVFCSLLWLVERSNPHHARAYFTKLSTGIGITENSPIAYVRKVLIEEQRNSAIYNKTRRRVTRGSIIALIIKGFNYYVDRIEVMRLMQIPIDVPEISTSV
jgi:hypothetical protein